jgi:hypothetical protein
LTATITQTPSLTKTSTQTPTVTPTIALAFNDCSTFIVNDENQIWNLGSIGSEPQFVTTLAGLEIANTINKIWLYSNNFGIYSIFELDVVLRPFDVVSNKTLFLSTNIQGLVAVNNTTLISTRNPGGTASNIVIEIDVSEPDLGSATYIDKFSLPGTGRRLSGDLFYNSYTNKLLVTSKQGINSYISQFNYTSPWTLEYDILISPTIPNPYGLAGVGTEVYIFDESGLVFRIDNLATSAFTQVTDLSSYGISNISAASQAPECISRPTPTPTITSTNTPTQTPTFTQTPTNTATQTLTQTTTPTNTTTQTTTPTNTTTQTPTQTLTQTPTNTTTLTPTNTTTQTPTQTTTQTPTNTTTTTPINTNTQTPTITQTPSNTSTQTPTQTTTPTPTNTRTQTPTQTTTQTQTPTNTTTQTPTQTTTQTNTPSNTATKTPTQTITPSNTATQTPTQTTTQTPTNTTTQTPTRTTTQTPTNTTTQTNTPSNTATQTPTQTNSATPKPTITPTKTSTPTSTTTQTPTQTISQTPTNTTTITQTPSQTITQTPTQTQTSTSTTTPTPSNTATQTPTQTTTITQTPTQTTTQTPSQTVTQTNTPSQTITQSPTQTTTQTPTQTATITQTPTQTTTQTITQTPTQTPTQTITKTPTQTPTQTNTPTITRTPTQTNTPTITRTPTGTITQTPTQTFTQTPSPTQGIYLNSCTIFANKTNQIGYLTMTNPPVYTPLTGFTSVPSGSLDIANTTTRVWVPRVSGTTATSGLTWWNITSLAPLSVNGPYTSVYPPGYVNTSGLMAIDNDTVIFINSLSTSQKVCEASNFVNGGTLSIAEKFNLVSTGATPTRIVNGDFMLTTTNKLIVATNDNNGASTKYYISQFLYSGLGAGTLELEIDVTSTLPNAIVGMFEYNGEIYVTTNITNNPIYKVTSSGVVLFDNLNNVTLGASTNLSCNVANL